MSVRSEAKRALRDVREQNLPLSAEDMLVPQRAADGVEHDVSALVGVLCDIRSRNPHQQLHDARDLARRMPAPQPAPGAPHD